MLAILLSTFNGEEYLFEQLNSLFSQTYNEFVLFVRDDGSTDSTVSIIKSFRNKYKNIVFFEDSLENIGACKSYLWLLQNVEADYYMFCDQDDVWVNNKIELSINALKCEEIRSDKLAIIVHTDLIVTDKKLNVISNSLWDNDNTNPLRITRKYLFLVNYLTGCTMLINKKARDISITSNETAIMHDFWVGICVEASNGVILSLSTPTVFYRQHERNVIGSKQKKSQHPILQRYLHIPNFRYSYMLYKMINSRYNISWYTYIKHRICFYLTR